MNVTLSEALIWGGVGGAAWAGVTGLGFWLAERRRRNRGR